MIPINRIQVDNLSKQLNSKQTFGKNDTILYPVFVHSLTNTDDAIKDFSTYEMAHWTNYADRWLTSRTSRFNTIGYPRGTLVYVDLGAGNFGHEPSFTHPGVVLSQNRDSILIAPCSSKKYGKGFPEIVDATTNDGFSINTGIQTNCIRWISKNRVISVIGTTSPHILNDIDSLILKSIPLHNKQMIEKENNLNTLKKEITELENSNKMLRAEIKQLKEQLANTSTDS